jgi:hypothetical protein
LEIISDSWPSVPTDCDNLGCQSGHGSPASPASPQVLLGSTSGIELAGRGNMRPDYLPRDMQIDVEIGVAA